MELHAPRDGWDLFALWLPMKTGNMPSLCLTHLSLSTWSPCPSAPGTWGTFRGAICAMPQNENDWGWIFLTRAFLRWSINNKIINIRSQLILNRRIVVLCRFGQPLAVHLLPLVKINTSSIVFAAMYLRYYLDENGKRVYTLQRLDPQGNPTLSAHPGMSIFHAIPHSDEISLLSFWSVKY